MSAQRNAADSYRQMLERVKSEIDHIQKHLKEEPQQAKASEEPGFVEKPLTIDERVANNVALYYKPCKVGNQSAWDDLTLYWNIKRCFDFVCALLALIVLSPFILCFLIAIYIEDPHGSPIFKQDRVGRSGKVFSFYKMRSMYVDAEEKLAELMKSNQVTSGKAFKMKNDPRITKIGKFIRNTSIDELLQLVNILKGDMSIVGPRPPLPREVALYDEYEMQRLFVTPGLTCFWQVFPGRHEISFADWVAFDLKYIQERSISVDLYIIWRTVCLIFKGAHD